MEELALSSIPPGGRAKVVALTGEGDIRKRISEMGVTRGAVIEVERVAPLGDPMDIKLRGYRLSLRKEEASHIMVAVI